jgi:hypothetical protein|tara:strand:- start:126 stop:473 length:348 start_codon:yes stop_codon:yes gene_type:complete
MARVLIAVLGIGKGSWGHVGRLISEEEWDKIIIIGNEWGQENFTPSKKVEWILVNNRAGFEVLKNAIIEKLPDAEFSVSLISGSGKEHMALLAALKDAKKDFKIVVLTGEGTKYY